jgi:gliding motility-associated lipoprotein GldH
MTPMNNRLKLVVIAILLFGCFSCNQNRVYEEYVGIASSEWEMTDTLSFDVGKNISADANIIAIKYNLDYPYRNLYLRYILKDHLGRNIKNELINVSLFESTTGKPLGKGYGSVFTTYDTLRFDPTTQFSKIQIIQNMRVDYLEGIETIGFKRIKNQ